MRPRFFIVDDEPDYATLLRYQLRKQDDPDVQVFDSGEAVLEEMRRLGPGKLPDLILLDVVMPGMGGLETLRALKKTWPDLPVVMVSAQSVVSVALEAMQLGAYDYVTKGHDDMVKVQAIAQHVTERAALTREVQALREQLPSPRGVDELLGESAAMRRVLQLVRKTLRGDLTVAILGESGTGKELVAQAIHHNSPRKRGPFVVVNCAAIPKDLMESEFFGHEKGSFTGAYAKKIGKFEQADGGTLFLDEVGELSLDLQAKLLRALQSRQIQRVGGSDTISFDARILCATNRDIAEMMHEGSFREDLYYRLFQFPIQLPPLRERDQDVLLLAEHFRRLFLDNHSDIDRRPFSAYTKRVMLHYPWPGNVRELKNAVERALLISDTAEITPQDLLLDTSKLDLAAAAPPPIPSDTPAAEPGEAPSPLEPSLSNASSPAYTIQRAAHPDDIVPIEDLKRMAVEHAYHLCDGNINQTASKLGITRSTVYRLLEKFDILT